MVPVNPATGVTVKVEVAVVPFVVVTFVAVRVNLLPVATVLAGQAVSRLKRSTEPRPLASS